MKRENNRLSNLELTIWMITVLVVSFLCYLPMLLERQGKYIPVIFSYAKYFFVLTPFSISIIFMTKIHHLKQWFVSLFQRKNIINGVLACIGLCVLGVSTTWGYRIITQTDHIWKDNDSNIRNAVVIFLYLYVMALIEECGWRGFLLNHLLEKGKRLVPILLTGVIWGIWHIPMWMIRNELGVKKMLLYFAWSILLSLVLGIMFDQCRNVLIVAFAHTVFNVCFLAPVLWNNIVIFAIIVCVVIVLRIKSTKTIV